MRVNFDSKALGDPRFLRLAGRLKIARPEAWGRILPVWMHAYENRSALMATADVDALAELEGFGAALADVGLAECIEGQLRLCGVRDRIEFLLQQDEKRAMALEAKKRAKLQRDAQPPGGPSRRSIARDSPNSPDLVLPQPPAQSGALAPEGASPGTGVDRPGTVRSLGDAANDVVKQELARMACRAAEDPIAAASELQAADDAA